MTDDATLAHLAGYGAIAAVLASAAWSGPAGTLVGWLFGLAVAVILIRETVARIGTRLRTEAEEAAREGITAADGGQEASP